MLPPHSPRHHPDPDPSCKSTGFLDFHIERTLASAIAAWSLQVAVREYFSCGGLWRTWCDYDGDGGKPVSPTADKSRAATRSRDEAEIVSGFYVLVVPTRTSGLYIDYPLTCALCLICHHCAVVKPKRCCLCAPRTPHLLVNPGHSRTWVVRSCGHRGTQAEGSCQYQPRPSGVEYRMMVLYNTVTLQHSLQE